MIWIPWAKKYKNGKGISKYAIELQIEYWVTIPKVNITDKKD